jgi:hypothetical protein
MQQKNLAGWVVWWEYQVFPWLILNPLCHDF